MARRKSDLGLRKGQILIHSHSKIPHTRSEGERKEVMNTKTLPHL